jgi:hypothetical protein
MNGMVPSIIKDETTPEMRPKVRTLFFIGMRRP